MKSLLKFLCYAIAVGLIGAGCFAGFISLRGVPKYDKPSPPDWHVDITPERVAVGEKIATLQCIFCHKGKNGKLSGKLISDLPPDFGQVHSANITHSKTYGIGTWTDGEIAYLLRTGVKRDGQYAPIYMPKYPHLSDEDLKCIIAWLRSDSPLLADDETATVPTQPSFLTKFLCFVAFKPIPYPISPLPQPDTTNDISYGRYLVTGRYDCWTCHSADFTTLDMADPEKTPGYCGGGNTMFNFDGHKIFTANITLDEQTGLGSWTADDFKRAMHESKNKSGKALRYPMLPYTLLTDREVSAIWQYLRSLPKIHNEVNRQWDSDL